MLNKDRIEYLQREIIELGYQIEYLIKATVEQDEEYVRCPAGIRCPKYEVCEDKKAHELCWSTAAANYAKEKAKERKDCDDDNAD